MPETDFSGVMGGKKKPKEQPVEKKPEPEPEQKEPAPQQAPASQPAPKPQQKQPTQQPTSNPQPSDSKAKELEEKIKKLEEELQEFHSKPKEQRMKEGENFEFKQLTEQIKQKVKEAPQTGFNAQAVEDAIKQVVPQPKSQAPLQKPSVELKRIPSGITGFDDLVQGGFESGSTILIVGSAGCGKTLFCLQFLYHGAVDYNEPGIFISFEEGRESLYKHSAAFGWDFEELEKKNLFRVLQYKPHQVEKLMKDGGGPIRDAIKEMGAKRLVIDSVTSYGLLFRDEYEKRENILGLFDYLKKWGCTSLIVSELPPKVAEIKEGSVGFLTDAIVSLYYSKQHETGERTHSMEILKMRGTKHTDKLLAVQFEKTGIVIYSDVEVF